MDFQDGRDQRNVGTAAPLPVAPSVLIVDVTLSLDTSAYTAGDVLADTQIVTGALRLLDGYGMLQSVVLIDEDDQGAALDLYFFSANRSLGAENGAPDISDANARDCLGCVAVGTADYKDLGGVKIATLKDINLPVKAVSASKNIYVGAVNGAGTPTYSASGLKLRLGFTQG